MSVYNNILNDEVLKTPWFIYIDEKKEFHKIYEGTAPEILNNGCGHFEETSIEKGNIALAGHNRGYNSNPFRSLKDLTIGSKVYYRVKNKLYEYQVIEKEKIKETDFLKIDRKDRILTLITCIENEKEYRLCVTAKEIF